MTGDVSQVRGDRHRAGPIVVRPLVLPPVDDVPPVRRDGRAPVPFYQSCQRGCGLVLVRHGDGPWYEPSTDLIHTFDRCARRMSEEKP